MKIFKIIITSLVFIILLYFFIFQNFINKQNFDIAIFVKNKNLINKYCKNYNIDNRLYVSVIFGELFNNLDYLDKFDKLKADLGLDPSIGFAQIRVSTAMWIENKFSDGNNIFKSRSHEELISKVINDSINILYSTFYVYLINKKLYEKYNKEPSIRTLASYYGRGIDYYRNEVDSSYFNQIGISAEEFYYSNKLIDVFPR